MSVSIDRKAGEVARLRTDESGRGPILQRTCLALLSSSGPKRFGPARAFGRAWQARASRRRDEREEDPTAWAVEVVHAANASGEGGDQVDERSAKPFVEAEVKPGTARRRWDEKSAGRCSVRRYSSWRRGPGPKRHS